MIFFYFRWRKPQVRIDEGRFKSGMLPSTHVISNFITIFQHRSVMAALDFRICVRVCGCLDAHPRPSAVSGCVIHVGESVKAVFANNAKLQRTLPSTLKACRWLLFKRFLHIISSSNRLSWTKLLCNLDNTTFAKTGARYFALNSVTLLRIPNELRHAGKWRDVVAKCSVVVLKCECGGHGTTFSRAYFAIVKGLNQCLKTTQFTPSPRGQCTGISCSRVPLRISRWLKQFHVSTTTPSQLGLCRLRNPHGQEVEAAKLVGCSCACS